jgi:hypothetical protein
MAYLQEQVTAYIIADPNLFVAEERALYYGEGLDDNWWIDVLIVDPWEKKFYLGEATYDPKPRRLLDKLAKFANQKTEVLKKIGRNGAPDGWDIRPWLFLREDTVQYVISRLPAGSVPRITYLEQTFRPWEYEKIKRTGSEPGKPYAGLESQFQH